MKNILSNLCWIAAIVAIAGCDAGSLSSTKEPERTLRQVVSAANDLARALESVRDHDSGRAAADRLDRTFAALNEELGKVPALMRDYASGSGQSSGNDELDDDLRKVFLRINAEIERLDNLQGLPSEFWRVFDVRSLDYSIKCIEIIPPGQAGSLADTTQYFRSVRDLLESRGFDAVVKVKLTNVSYDLVQKACDKLQELAPGARLYHSEIGDEMTVALGPVRSFTDYVAAIDFGDVIVENQAKRFVKLKARRGKLGGREEALADDTERERKQREKEEREREARMLEERMAAAKREPARANERKDEELPNAGDPNYYDKLADLVMSTEHFTRERAIDILLKKKPSDVPSLETRKKIAKAFKELAEERQHGFQKEKVIRGLVIWGGKYSGPILMRMLEDSHSFDAEHVIRALGQIKYGPAALAIAAHLGDFHNHRTAYAALRQLGADAEEALIQVGPSENPQICFAAVELLGDCGSAKCLSLLSKGLSSRNRQVREACKNSIRKVKDRLDEAKDKAKEDEEDPYKP